MSNMPISSASPLTSRPSRSRAAAAPRDTVQVKAVRPDRDKLEIRFPRVEGYRVELPNERLEATFNAESELKLTPELVGPSHVKDSGIIGQTEDLNLEHLDQVRPSSILFHLTRHLIYNFWRDPGEEPKLHLFGDLKRVARQWLDNYLVCIPGSTYPGLLLYKELADMACQRITAGITHRFLEERPVKAMLDPYNPTGSTMHVRFNTSRPERWTTDPKRCHINLVIYDSDWEAEFCRVAEAHPRVVAYVENHGLGFEMPYRHGGKSTNTGPTSSCSSTTAIQASRTVSPTSCTRGRNQGLSR